MMKKFILILVITFSINLNSQSLDTIKKFDYKKHFDLILKETKKTKSEYSYLKQLEKFKKEEAQTNLEVLSMLISYTDNKNYQPYLDILFLDKELFDLNEEGKFIEVIEKGNKILEKAPFLIKVLREVSYAYSNVQNDIMAEKCLLKTGKIYNAMLYSSTISGTTNKEPMFALYPKDGQYFLKYFLKSKITSMGSGSDINGYFVDILGSDFQNTQATFYFNLEHAKNKMMK